MDVREITTTPKRGKGGVSPVELRVPSAELAAQIARDSKHGEIIPLEDGWGVRAERLLIDLRACAEALGRPLTKEEWTALQFKDLPPKMGRQVMRYADYVEVGPRNPSTRATIHLPGALGNFVKREAETRGMSLTQFVEVILEYYFLSYGTAEEAIRDHVEGKFGDMKKWYGLESIMDVVTDSRKIGKGYYFPYVATVFKPVERWLESDQWGKAEK